MTYDPFLDRPQTAKNPPQMAERPGGGCIAAACLAGLALATVAVLALLAVIAGR